MQDLNQRLDAALKRRSDIEAVVRRAEGKLEAARAALATLEAECREQGIDPQNIDIAVATLEAEANAAIADFEAQVAQAEANLKPFLTETK